MKLLDLSNPWVLWAVLGLAGLLEVVWSAAMKASNGFTETRATVLCLAAAWASFGLLGLALKALPLGTSYAVWTGIGAVGAAVVGILYFGEPATLPRLFCIAMIVAGIIGLKLLTPAS